MHIKEYMFRKKMTIQDMADLLDYSIPQVVNARAGRRVSPKFARRVERMTNGVVTMEDVLNPEEINTIVVLPKPVEKSTDYENVIENMG